MKTTIKELSEKLNVNPTYVNGFINTLVALGKAKVVGKVDKVPGQRGKTASIFEVDDNFVN